MNDILIQKVVDTVLDKIKDLNFINVEASGRHIHLNKECMDILFGNGYILEKQKDLSQPGQYLCKEKVRIVGPKGFIERVAILGPLRKNTQVEVSLTDSKILGINIPIRESGDLDNTPGIRIESEKSSIKIDKGVIVAKRHIHMTPKDAKKLNLKDLDIVKVQIMSNRKLIFDDVTIRVCDKYKTSMHIDYDEANACGYNKKVFAKIVKDI
ncbi:phosphate propanoyltransferase [Tepidibacter sp. Z1-5]|uniref:phosphate propanoyltransferase n=1 Tax=Tepidibacter sp. Z1-5 TaxID=3134138 RepID=UPI0030C2572C